MFSLRHCVNQLVKSMVWKWWCYAEDMEMGSHLIKLSAWFCVGKKWIREELFFWGGKRGYFFNMSKLVEESIVKEMGGENIP